MNQAAKKKGFRQSAEKYFCNFYNPIAYQKLSKAHFDI